MFVFIPGSIPPVRIGPAGTDQADISIPVITYVSIHFNVRPGLHGERVLDCFNMVISGMKKTFYTSYIMRKYVKITNRNNFFFLQR